MLSIVTTHRNRIECLECFLSSLKMCDISFLYEIVIVDLGSSCEISKVTDKYNKLPIHIKEIDYSGPFWKTKALNFGILNAKYEFITIADVDSVFTKIFTNNLFKFLETNKEKTFKLSHRVKFFDGLSNDAKDLIFKGKDVELESFCKNNYFKMRLAIERYTEKEIPLRSDKIANTYLKQSLGNSHFTMRKKDILSIGGYDERFIGHGLEDLDFNLRMFRHLKSGIMIPTIDNTIFHISHNYESDWNSENFKVNNREIYRQNKNRHTIFLDKKEDWGKFK